MRNRLAILAIAVAAAVGTTALADKGSGAGSGSGKGSGSGSGSVKVDSTKRSPTDPPADPNGPLKWDPVRWQSPDGQTVTFQIAAKRDAKPELTITIGEDSYDLPLKGSYREIVPAFVMVDEDVVITSGATPGVAWRFAWKKGKVVQTKSVYWAKDKARPAWAVNATPADATSALKRIAALLRFGNTVPGLQQFFADPLVTWNVYTRGEAEPWKRSMAGKDALLKWIGAGYPVLRGKLKIAKGCMTLPANADGKPAAPAAPPDAPHLQKLCLDKDLHVSEIQTLIAPDAKGEKGETIVTP
jgi:hypothetical protein